CAEKYLKGLLEELGLPIPKIRDLDQLFTLLRPHHPTLKSILRGLVFLTDFAVDIRYPGNWATKRQAEAAWRWAERVRQASRTLRAAPQAITVVTSSPLLLSAAPPRRPTVSCTLLARRPAAWQRRPRRGCQRGRRPAASAGASGECGRVACVN